MVSLVYRLSGTLAFPDVSASNPPLFSTTFIDLIDESTEFGIL